MGMYSATRDVEIEVRGLYSWRCTTVIGDCSVCSPPFGVNINCSNTTPDLRFGHRCASVGTHLYCLVTEACVRAVCPLSRAILVSIVGEIQTWDLLIASIALTIMLLLWLLLLAVGW